MSFHHTLYKIRVESKLSQEEFAHMFGVSRQAVQKWESGDSYPDIVRLLDIAKRFDLSLDNLLLHRDKRAMEELKPALEMAVDPDLLPDWELYITALMTEYRQCVDEGLDIRPYKELFETVAHLPKDNHKMALGDVIFDIVLTAPLRDDYPYREPSELDAIRALRQKNDTAYPVDRAALPDKIRGAWLGRICGCLLGKTVEGIRTDELHPFLKETGNFPLSRYIRRSEVTNDIIARYTYPFATRDYADTGEGMPADDDTNYMVLAQRLIDLCGRNFTDRQVAELWLSSQPKNAYCTAERVAFCNFIKGYAPPQSARYKNPYREWIGAQIRGDYFGYICPGDPETAAAMAYRDASISHVKNGIYGEMFVAAMLAVAASTSDIETIIEGGLAEVPAASRFHEAITAVLNDYRSGASQKEAFARIRNMYSEFTPYGWCHVIPNAMIVCASLLYGGGDYGKSICMAVETGYDTDCNGATVGSVLGLAYGANIISNAWTAPIGDILHTDIFGVGTVSIADCIAKTLAHIE